jgi:hypothetical protein
MGFYRLGHHDRARVAVVTRCFIMDDDWNGLREQARQWRRMAARYTPGLARALNQAAAALDAQADRIEGIPGAPPVESSEAARPKNR